MDWLQELEIFYGKEMTPFAKEVFRQRLQKLAEEELITAVANCFCKYPAQYRFFPSADLLLELAKGSQPQENHQAYLPLPSSEMKEMTAEEQAANIRKLNELIRDMGRKK